MRLGPDAQPSDGGELCRVCGGCFAASGRAHTAADVTKVLKVVDAGSRYADPGREPPPVALAPPAPPAHPVVARDRTELFLAKRAPHAAEAEARVEAAARGYASLSVSGKEGVRLREATSWTLPRHFPDASQPPPRHLQTPPDTSRHPPDTPQTPPRHLQTPPDTS